MNSQSKVSQVLATLTILRVNKCPTVNHWGMREAQNHKYGGKALLRRDHIQ